MREFLRRAWYVVRRRRLEADLSEEIEHHRELKEEELERRGLTPAEAALQSRRALGNVLLARERARDVWIPPWLQDVGQDLRFAARLLLKDRAFTLVAVTTLALGIGINGTVFTVVNALSRGLPVDDPDRIVRLGMRNAAGRSLPVSFADFEDWRGSTTSFEGVAAYSDTQLIVADETAAPDRFSGSYLSWNAFQLVGDRPMLGRDFRPEDDRPEAPPVVILGYRVWNGRYSNDPAVVGRTIRVNGVPAVVVGVMPEGFRFPVVSDLWQPLAHMPGLATQKRDARTLSVFARLATGKELSEAQAELTAIAERLARAFPDTNKELRATVTPFVDSSAGRRIFAALLAAVGFVLLIACANIANLLLARAAFRQREMAMRASLGATRWRIVRQLLVESALLLIVAGILGFVLAFIGLRAFVSHVHGINFPYNIQWTMDTRVISFMAAACLGSGLIFGLVPALHLSRSGVYDVLKESGRTAFGSARSRRWMRGLIGIELAFTLVLLAGAGLMMRSFLALHRADEVVDGSHVVAMGVTLPVQRYPREQWTVFYDRLMERLQGIGPIASASLTSNVPFAGARRRTLTVDGRPPPKDGTTPNVSFVAIGPEYFEALGVPLLRGRAFTALDGTPGQETVIVNERLAGLHFPNEEPLGRRIRLSDPVAAGAQPPWLTIVGVSPSIRQQQPVDLQELDPVAYVPMRADLRPFATLLVRGPAPEGLAALVRQEVQALDPELAVSGIISLRVLEGQSRWAHRVFGLMFAVFAAVALAVSAVGLYAMTAYSVRQRTQEIGVRMALGAQRGDVVRLFVRQVFLPLGAGLVAGFGGALIIGRLLRSFLMQTSAADPATLASIAALLVAVALAASFWPARRATRLDPVTALRYE
jgi:putative ABC transport system permease protein